MGQSEKEPEPHNTWCQVHGMGHRISCNCRKWWHLAQLMSQGKLLGRNYILSEILRKKKCKDGGENYARKIGII